MSHERRIFIGDIQGCREELEELLEAVSFDQSADELHPVGDLVNRGPDSLRILRAMRDLVESGRGRIVLGNHELALLHVAAGLRELSPRDTMSDILEAPDSRDWIDWLRAQPLAVIGTLAESGAQSEAADDRSRFAMVHAAVHPDWELSEIERRARTAEARLSDPDSRAFRQFLAAKEDPDRDVVARLTRCRSVSASGAWSVDPPDEDSSSFEAWHELWSRRRHRYGVVYGHWARQGLHVAPGLRGLDTGCVHHGRGRDGYLTAWLPDPESRDPFAIPDESFWHIRARRAYYAERLSTV